MVWSCVILAATSLPGPLLPRAPHFPGADKVAHAILYGVLGFLAWRAVSRDWAPARPWLGPSVRLLAAIAVFAAVDEWHQQFIPGRGAEGADWVADVAGATVGLTISRAAPWRRGLLS